MALDERKRQQKLAKKNAKRKKSIMTARQEQSTVVNLMNDPTSVAIATSAAVVYECHVSKKLFETGLGHAVISKLMPNGRIAMSAFLLDVYCLGVRSISAKAMSPEEFREQIRLIERQDPMAKKDASYVKKLVESAEAWASGLGFSPHPDYHVAKQLLSDIVAENCTETFEFGKDGKPMFIQGPTDTAAKVRQVLATLTKSCGAGGFEALVMVGAAAGDNA